MFHNLNARILFPIWIIQYIFASAIKISNRLQKQTTTTESFFYGFVWKLGEKWEKDMLLLAKCHVMPLTFTFLFISNENICVWIAYMLLRNSGRPEAQWNLMIFFILFFLYLLGSGKAQLQAEELMFFLWIFLGEFSINKNLYRRHLIPIWPVDDPSEFKFFSSAFNFRPDS